MTASLTQKDLSGVLDKLRQANLEHLAAYPGETDRRQPVQTVYGGAHLFQADSGSKMGQVALRTLQQNAPDSGSFAAALHPSSAAPDHGLWERIYRRVVEKLEREPVEDFRIDFEDGFGARPDAEEDRHAERTAREVALGMRNRTLPPFIGIRIKPLNQENRARSLRTLDLFLNTLAGQSEALPANFVITLPKIVNPMQVEALSEVLGRLEERLGLAEGSLTLELMVETPQSIFNPRGEVALRALVEAAAGRCIAAHFGVYDYTASCSITAAHQSMTHPACDFARHVMQVALAGSGIWLSDGATNIMPVGPHRQSTPNAPLTEAQRRENREAVHGAWRLSYQHIRHSLEHGFYQGWDLHPAQFPIRYAAVYAFFLEGIEAASQRLANFVQMAAQATLVGTVFDDAATGQALLNFFLRGINSGALTEQEATRTGLSVEEIRMRSFKRILEGRAR